MHKNKKKNENMPINMDKIKQKYIKITDNFFLYF